MNPSLHTILKSAVDDGVAIGLARAYKEYDRPTPEQIVETIKSDVMNQITVWFRFHKINQEE